MDNHVDVGLSTAGDAWTGGGSGNTDEDQAVNYIYDGLDNVAQLVVLGTGDTTTYLFEDAYNASLATNVIYPDSSDTTSSGSDQVKKTYFLDGLVKSMTDQRGTVVDYSYTTSGGSRALEWEKVTTVGSGVDDHVRSKKYAYDSLGRMERLTSYATTTGGTIRNELHYTFDKTLAVDKSYQSHEGVVSTSTTPKVTYNRDFTVSYGLYSNGLRVSSVDYPSGKKIDLKYDSHNSVNDLLHRINQIDGNFTGSTLTLSQYKYSGTSGLVETLYSQNSARSRMDEGDGDGTYENLDHFARVKTKDWRVSTTIKDQFNYTHDYASNRLSRDIPSSLYSTNDLDQVYTYDDLHRVTTFDEGTLSGTTISSPKSEQDWTLQILGNWSTLVEKTSGSTTLDQDRSHNDANEITDIDSSSSHVGHDAAGNMTKVPKPSSWSAHYDLTFDAWNRLVEIKDGADTVADYEYDGLNRRIVKTVGSDTYHYYYTTTWQAIEVRKDGVTDPVEQYVWHPYYIDALAVRYHDANTDGDYLDTNEVHYYTHDANFNVTSLTDGSGNVIERYSYSPYGKMVVRDANFAVDSDGVSDVDNPYVYTGRRFDDESGIFYYRNRYLHAQLGRFVSRDPIGYADGASLYAIYGVLNATDPFGLERHHYVVRSLWESDRANSLNFSDEAKSVFRNATIEAPGHRGNLGHAAYTRAVTTESIIYIARNEIDPATMTAEQARNLVNHIKNSPHPEIRGFLKRITSPLPGLGPRPSGGRVRGRGRIGLLIAVLTFSSGGDVRGGIEALGEGLDPFGGASGMQNADWNPWEYVVPDPPPPNLDDIARQPFSSPPRSTPHGHVGSQDCRQQP